MMNDTQLNHVFSALADPTRRDILSRLGSGEQSVSDLAEPYGMTMPAITKHLKVLERAGLVSRSRRAQWRPCKLEAGALRGAADWLEAYRVHWEGTLDHLHAFLNTQPPEESKNDSE